MIKERYNRQIILNEIGIEGQKKIFNTKVLVVGAGGLGSPVLQYLTAMGIGIIGIIDFDIINISNLQRQILYNETNINKIKVLEAKKYLNNLNSNTKIITYNEKLTYSKAIEIFPFYDIIIDCTDNIKSRYIINDACILKNKPFIYGSVNEFSGQISVFNYKGSATYRCLFPEENKKNDKKNGIMGFIPATISSLQVAEVTKIILNKGEILTNTLLIYNSLNSTFEKIYFEKQT